jgi:hypothetical protein
MPARNTSRRAYDRHVKAGRATRQEDRILALLRWSDRPLSRAEICRYFTAEPLFPKTWDNGPVIPLASVCGRVDSLVKSGLVTVMPYREIDPRSKHPVEVLMPIVPAPKQLSFERLLELPCQST